MRTITLALIGHSGLDEDKCFGAWRSGGGSHQQAFALHPGVKGEMLANEFLDATGLGV